MNNTIRALQAVLPRYTCEYLRAAATQPALAPYASGEVALTALQLTSTLSHAQRDGIVRALVLERRASKHPLWPTLLILAFGPALRRLGRRAGGWRVEDLGQVLVQSLLEAVDGTSLRSVAFVLCVRRATARKLFQKLRARRQPRTEPVEGERTPAVPWHREPSAFVTCAAREVLRACARVPGGVEAALSRAGVTGDDTPDPDSMGTERRLASERARQRAERVLDRVRKELVG
jgi:hypothetical protein